MLASCNFPPLPSNNCGFFNKPICVFCIVKTNLYTVCTEEAEQVRICYQNICMKCGCSRECPLKHCKFDLFFQTITVLIYLGTPLRTLEENLQTLKNDTTDYPYTTVIERIKFLSNFFRCCRFGPECCELLPGLWTTGRGW